MSNAPIQFVEDYDREAVCTLMRDVWPRPCWDYRPEVLAAFLDGPGAAPQLQIAVLRGEKLVGYQGMVTLRARHGGREYRLAFRSFWTVRPESAGAGVALQSQRELLRRSNEAGLQGTLNICQTDSHAARSFRAVMRRLGEQPVRLALLPVWMATPGRLRTRSEKAQNPDRFRLMTPSDAEAVSDFIRRRATEMDFCQTPDPDEAHFLFLHNPDTRAWIYQKDGRVEALLSARRQSLLLEKGTRLTANCEALFLDGIEDSQRRQFLACVLDDPFWEDVAAIEMLGNADADPEALKEMGFTTTGKNYDLYYHPLNDGPLLEKANRLWLRVF